MALRHLMWIGPGAQPGREELIAALSSAFGQLTIDVEQDLSDGLRRLAAEPTRWAAVVADLRGARWAAGGVVPRIKQINPDIEVVLLLQSQPNWSGEELPLHLRPVLLCEPVSPTGLVSAVAKLMELSELRRDYGQLSQGFTGRLVMARRNVEAALELLYRMMGVGIVTVRRDGFLAFYDSEVRRLTGSAPNELTHVGAWLASLLADPDQAEQVLAALERAWARGAGRREIMLELAGPDGPGRTLAMSIMVIVGDQGDPRQLVLIFYDPKDRTAALEYELLLASPELGVYTYYPERGFARFNQAALRLLNQAFDLELTEGQVLSRHPEQLPLPPEEAARWQDILAAAAAGQTEGEHPPLGLPGRRVLAHAALAMVEREAESPGVVAQVRPRPELTQALPGAMASGQAGLALQALPHALMLLEAVRGEGGEIIDFTAAGVNPAAWRLLGRMDFFRPQMSLAELFSDEAARERLFAEACRVTEGGSQVSLEIGVRLTRSESRLMSIWLGRVGDGVALILEDITAQREAERRQRQYQHIFTHMEEAIIVTDLAGAIIDWNPAAEKMFGYAKQEVLGKDTRMLVPDARSQELARYGAKVIRDGDVWKGEYEFKRKDGSRGMGFTVMALLKDDEGRAYGTVGLTRDVTQRRRLQDNLTMKSQELQEKNIALNTLLRHAEEERLRACQAVAADVGKRITQRVHQILDHAESPQMVREMAGLLLSDLGQRPASEKIDPADPTLTLTEKELEVARLIRSGKTSEQIAALLGKSPDTVRLQRISIRKKLGLTGRDMNLVNYLNRIDLI